MSDTYAEWEESELPDDQTLSDRLKETARRSPRYVKLVIGMVRDPDVPLRSKTALVLGGSYVVSPIDLIPGFIPILGQIDDLVVMMAALGAAKRMTSPDLMQKHMVASGLTDDEMKRDAETAEMAGRWAVGKGISVARTVAEKGASAVFRTTQKGFAMISERVQSRQA